MNDSGVSVDFLCREEIQRDDEDEKKHGEEHEALCGSGDDTVIPREYGQFVETSD